MVVEGDRLLVLRQETGLTVTVGRLLYVCDHLPAGRPHVLHLTFEAERTGGTLGDIAAGADSIHDVAFVALTDLPSLGSTERFTTLARAGFPGAGSYQGLKATIGL